MQRHKIASLLAVAMLWACGNDEGSQTTSIALPGVGGGGNVAPVAGDEDGTGGGNAGRGNGGAGNGGGGVPGQGGDWAGPDESGDLPGGGPIEFATEPGSPGWPTGKPKQQPQGGSEEAVVGLGNKPAGTPGKVHAKAEDLEASLDYTTEAEAAASVELIVRNPEIPASEPTLHAKVVVRAASGSGRVTAGTRAAVVLQVPGQAPIEADAEVDADGLCDVALDVPAGMFQIGAVLQATAHARLVHGGAESPKVGVTLGAGIDAAQLPTPGIWLSVPSATAAPGTELALVVHARTLVNPLEKAKISVQGDGAVFEFLDAKFGEKYEGSFEVGNGSIAMDGARGAKTAISAVTGASVFATIRVRIKVGATIGAKGWLKVQIGAMTTLAEVPLLAPDTAGVVADSAGLGAIGHVTVGSDVLRGLVVVVRDAVLVNSAALDGKAVERPVRTLAVWQSGKDEDVTATLESEDPTVCGVAEGKVVLKGAEKKGAGKVQILAKWKGAMAVARIRVLFPYQIRIELDDGVLERVAGAPEACAGFAGYQHTRARVLASFGTSADQAFEADVTGLVQLSSTQPTVASCDTQGIVRGVGAGSFVLVARGGPDGGVLAERKAACSDETVTVESLEAVAATSLGLSQVGTPVGPALDAKLAVLAHFKQQLHVAQKAARVLAWAKCSDGAMMPVTESMGLRAEIKVQGIVELAEGPLRVIAMAEGEGKLILAKWTACGAGLAEGWVWIRVKWSTGGGGGTGDGGGGGGNGDDGRACWRCSSIANE